MAAVPEWYYAEPIHFVIIQAIVEQQIHMLIYCYHNESDDIVLYMWNVNPLYA